MMMMMIGMWKEFVGSGDKILVMHATVDTSTTVTHTHRYENITRYIYIRT